MTEGCTLFKMCSLICHEKNESHNRAGNVPKLKSAIEKAVLMRMLQSYNLWRQCTGWLVKNCHSQYMNPLLDSWIMWESPNLDKLAISSHTNCSSNVSANEMLNAVSDTTDNSVNDKLLQSPFSSLFVEENTDINNKNAWQWWHMSYILIRLKHPLIPVQHWVWQWHWQRSCCIPQWWDSCYETFL